MAKEQARAFFEALGRDPALYDKVAGLQSESDWDRVLVIAADAGYTFTIDEAREAFRELYGSAPRAEELSDEELATVAGGKGGGPTAACGPSTSATGCGPGLSTAKPGWSLSKACGGAHPCSDCDF